MSETKAAFAERTIRSLKKILHRYTVDNRYKHIHKLTQFVTTPTFRRNCSIDLVPKYVENSDILSILYSKQLWEVRKTKFENGDRQRISKHELPSEKVINHSLHQRFPKLSHLLPEILQYKQ